MLRRLADIIFTVIPVLLVALWLVSVTFCIILTEPVTHWLAFFNVEPKPIGPDKDYLVAIADAVRAFSLGNDAAPLPVGSDDTIAITPDALSHLVDVRVVFTNIINITIVTTFVTAIVLVIVAIKRGRRALGKAIGTGGKVPLVVGVIILIIGVINFQALFTAMHKLFFADGTWQFSSDSLLIRSLPEGFWSSAGAAWVILLVIACLLAICIGRIIKNRAPKTQS